MGGGVGAYKLAGASADDRAYRGDAPRLVSCERARDAGDRCVYRFSGFAFDRVNWDGYRGPVALAAGFVLWPVARKPEDLVLAERVVAAKEVASFVDVVFLDRRTRRLETVGAQRPSS